MHSNLPRPAAAGLGVLACADAFGGRISAAAADTQSAAPARAKKSSARSPRLPTAGRGAVPAALAAAADLCRRLNATESASISRSSASDDGGDPILVAVFTTEDQLDAQIGDFAEYLGRPFCTAAISANRRGQLVTGVLETDAARAFNCETMQWRAGSRSMPRARRAPRLKQPGSRDVRVAPGPCCPAPRRVPGGRIIHWSRAIRWSHSPWPRADPLALATGGSPRTFVLRPKMGDGALRPALGCRANLVRAHNDAARIGRVACGAPDLIRALSIAERPPVYSRCFTVMPEGCLAVTRL
jgi:hypothetical protein